MVKNVKRIDRHVKQQQLEQLSTGCIRCWPWYRENINNWKFSDELKPEFWAQVLKLYHYPDENNWKFQYDTISTAKRYLKAEKYLSQAQHALLGSHI